MSKPHTLGQLRIIGGKFKSRTIAFAPLPGLRPTPNRVRETLFNWLSNYIVGATCLDAFAGSGALAFEAISRGAAFVTLIESASLSIKHLHTAAQQLNITNLEIIQADTLQYLSQLSPQLNKQAKQYNIVFLDPPFDSQLVIPLVNLLEQQQLLRHEAVIYLETARPMLANITNNALSHTWRSLKQAQAGKVYYNLFQKI